jgi:hypothetical protein
MACAIRIREIEVGNAEGDIPALAEDDVSGAIEIDEEVFEEG